MERSTSRERKSWENESHLLDMISSKLVILIVCCVVVGVPIKPLALNDTLVEQEHHVFHHEYVWQKILSYFSLPLIAIL